MTTKAKTRLSKSDRLPDVFCQPTSVPLDSRVGYILISDPTVRRLKLRITKTGAKSWVHVGPRSYTIGAFDDWPYPVVREEAHRLNRLVDQGQDPHDGREARLGAPTVAELIERWHQDIDSKVPPKVRQSTLKEYTGQINQWILPQLGKKRVTDVTKEDIEALHTLITKTGKKRGTPSRANRVLSLISALFNFGVRKKICAEN